VIWVVGNRMVMSMAISSLGEEVEAARYGIVKGGLRWAGQ
jgi:hypothetical protein